MPLIDRIMAVTFGAASCACVVFVLIPALWAGNWGLAALSAVLTVAGVGLLCARPKVRVSRELRKQLQTTLAELPQDRPLLSADRRRLYRFQRGRVGVLLARGEVADLWQAEYEVAAGQVSTISADVYFIGGAYPERHTFVGVLRRLPDGELDLEMPKTSLMVLRSMLFARRHGLTAVTEEEIAELIVDLRNAAPGESA